MSKIKYKLKKENIFSKTSIETFFWLFFIEFIMLKCFYLQFTTQVNVRPFITRINFIMLLSTFGFLLIIISPILMIPGKARVITLFIVDVLLTAIFIADTNFFRYYYSAITIPVFYQVNFKIVSSVDESILSIFKIKDIIYILDLPFMIGFIVFFIKKGVRQIKLKARFIAFLVVIALGASIFTLSYKRHNESMFPYDNNYIIRSLGILYFHFYDASDFLENQIFGERNLVPQEKAEIEAFYRNRSKTGNNLRGVAQGKNLIMVQVEALQGFVINNTINGKEITPNLNKLIKECLYFDNIYYQVSGGNTSDAEFLSNVSLYPLYEGSVYSRFPNNTYYSLPKALKELGYTTSVFHAFDADFWNRREAYKAIGFDNYYYVDHYIKDDFAGWDGTALSDASFFRQSIEKFDKEKPFYSFLITLSSHHPFTYFEDFDFDVGKYEGTYFGNYLKAVNYADKCLGQFINDLKAKGLWDNSLVVIYGDHQGVTKQECAAMFEYLDIGYSECEWIKLQKVPLIIHYPGLENGSVYSNIGGEVDIFPTIANLMGFTPKYAIGKDLINTNESYAILRNGSIVSNEFIYISNEQALYDYNTGDPLPINNYVKKINALINELCVSDIILEKDAFKK